MGPRAAASPGMPVQANRATHTGGVIRSGSQPTVTQGKPIVNISAESATQMVQRNQDRGMQWIPFWGEVDVPHLKGAKQQEGHPVHTAHIQGTCIQRCFQHLHSPPPEQGHRKSCSARAYAHICRPASGLASRARLPYTVSHAGGGCICTNLQACIRIRLQHPSRMPPDQGHCICTAHAPQRHQVPHRGPNPWQPRKVCAAEEHKGIHAQQVAAALTAQRASVDVCTAS